jgi:D-alanyl-D-alanine endopeptidase (penicillin-binding protein 7)
VRGAAQALRGAALALAAVLQMVFAAPLALAWGVESSRPHAPHAGEARRQAAGVGDAPRKPAATRGALRRPAPSRAAQGELLAHAAAPQLQAQVAGVSPIDALQSLHSSVALVVDQASGEVLLSKNANAVVPIASITKLMTALVVVESGAALGEMLEISADDLRATAGSTRRLLVGAGTRLSRGELLHLALMSSENRAAQALGRLHPEGLAGFVRAMNTKALALGMADTRFVDPTGLSADNRSSARDLALLVRSASAHPAIRDYSTRAEATLPIGARLVNFRNTNGLVRRSGWDIAVQKTGYIAAAGHCVVMQAHTAGREVIMVLLDSAGRYSPFGDAERLRRWLFEAQGPRAPMRIAARGLALPLAAPVAAAEAGSNVGGGGVGLAAAAPALPEPAGALAQAR